MLRTQSSMNDSLFQLVRFTAWISACCLLQARLAVSLQAGSWRVDVQPDRLAGGTISFLRLFAQRLQRRTGQDYRGPPAFSSLGAGKFQVLASAQLPLICCLQLQSAWTSTTAGGNHSCASFFSNPQFCVKLSAPPGSSSAKAELEVVGETAKDSPINLKLLLRAGQRVDG